MGGWLEIKEILFMKNTDYRNKGVSVNALHCIVCESQEDLGNNYWEF